MIKRLSPSITYTVTESFLHGQQAHGHHLHHVNRRVERKARKQRVVQRNHGQNPSETWCKIRYEQNSPKMHHQYTKNTKNFPTVGGQHRSYTPIYCTRASKHFNQDAPSCSAVELIRFETFQHSSSCRKATYIVIENPTQVTQPG